MMSKKSVRKTAGLFALAALICLAFIFPILPAGTAYADSWRPEPDTAVLKAHWEFNNNLNDSAGDFDLVLAGESSGTGSGYVEGFNGKPGYKFNGTTALRCAGTSLKNVREMTVSFYYRADGWTESGNGDASVFSGEGNDVFANGAVNLGFYYDTANPLKSRHAFIRTNAAYPTQDFAVTDGTFDETVDEWHHYVYVLHNYKPDPLSNTYDAYVGIYVDGKEVYFDESAAMGLTYNLGAGAIGFTVGGQCENGGVIRALNGVLSDLRIYDGAWLDDDITEFYETNGEVEKPYDPEEHVAENFFFEITSSKTPSINTNQTHNIDILFSGYYEINANITSGDDIISVERLTGGLKYKVTPKKAGTAVIEFRDDEYPDLLLGTVTVTVTAGGKKGCSGFSSAGAGTVLGIIIPVFIIAAFAALMMLRKRKQ